MNDGPTTCRLNRKSGICVDIQAVSVAGIPLFLAISVASMLSMIAPFYAGLAGYGFDPSYQYLFNGAGLVQGYVPRHVDHPGTPLQTLSGIVVYFAWLSDWLGGHTKLAFKQAVVHDPEHYIDIVSFFLLFINVMAVMYFGLRVKAATQSLAMALIAQAGVAMLNAMIPRFGYLSPEALLIFAGVMTLACLSDTLLSFSPLRDAMSDRTAVAVGCLLALGSTVKIDFLPWTFLLAVLPTKRARMIGFLSLVLFTVLFLLPIVSELLDVVRWYYKITTHTGHYGDGQKGFIDMAAVPMRLSALYQNAGLVFVAGGASVIAVAICLFDKVDTNSGARRRWCVWVSVILLGVLAVQLGLVLKHFALHYILPSCIISSIILVRTLRLLEFRLAHAGRAIAAMTAAVLVFLAAQQSYANLTALSAEKKVRDYQVASMQRTLNENPGAIVIGTYYVRNEDYATQFGLAYVDDDFARRADRGTIQDISYSRWDGSLQRVGGSWIELSYLNQLIAQGREVLMILPPDVQIPALKAEVLLQIPGQERILRVLHVQ